MSTYRPPVNRQEREHQDTESDLLYAKHSTVPGTYSEHGGNYACTLEDEAEGGHPAREIAEPARFRLETPLFQRPATHWSGYFECKEKIECSVRDAGAVADPPKQLVGALAWAIKEREWAATQYAWYKIKGYANKTALGLEELKITVELVHFLLFRVQAPDLFCTIVHQHVSGKGWHTPCMPTPISGEEELVPMVAALVEAVHYVKRVANEGEGEGECFADDVDWHKRDREHWEGHGYAPANAWWRSEVGAAPGYSNDTWWHRAITLLIPQLPRRPKAISRYQAGSVRPVTTSLLERVVLCSELSTAIFEQLMSCCEWKECEVHFALNGVLWEGNVRGGTGIRIACVLYAKLWGGRSYPGSAKSSLENPNWRLEKAWEELIWMSCRMQKLPMQSTKKGFVVVPFAYRGGSQRFSAGESVYDAGYYTQLADGFFDVHDRDGERDGDAEALEGICYHAMRVLIQEGQHRTYLVDLLVDQASARKFLSKFLYAPRFLSTVVMHHEVVWKDMVRCHFREWYSSEEHSVMAEKEYCAAMEYLVRTQVRHGVDALVDVVAYLPEKLMTEDALRLFVRNMCVPVTKGDEMYSRAPNDDTVRICWEGLRAYLTCGGMERWRPEVLKAGLHEAWRYASAVAAEVFLSEPWNVEPDPSDKFSLAIVAELLAPGEQAVLATGERFAKRQRGEAGER